MTDSKFLFGKILAEQVKQRPTKTALNDVEFSVYSQFGEDGIIQFITHHLRHEIQNKIFVEIGVQNYSEANTRFLLENDAWQGVLIDACVNDIKQIQESPFYWRNNLHAKNAFITQDNINSILAEFSLPQEIGLLSLDIDGNDYWVLKNLNVLNPCIIIVEYNSFFGPELPISVPYRENFIWRQFHPAPYFSASLAAFCHLLENRGYELLGSCTAGNNAFFVRKDINKGKLTAVTCNQGYRQAIFNLTPCKSLNKFDEQLIDLRYHQLINVKDNSFWRLSGDKITAQSLTKEFNHIDDFLRFEHNEFIENAFRYLLCREPEKKDIDNYLKQLKKGKNKEEILKTIRFSTEGQNVNSHIVGIDPF